MAFEKELRAAVGHGDLNLCVDLIRRGADVNAFDPDGTTLLMKADRCGHVEIRSLFLASGALVDTRDLHGYTALMSAASFGREEACRAFLDAGARVDALASTGEQVLAAAAATGRISICTMLLDAGADVNASDVYMRTALTTAARHSHLDVCKLLIERGADVNELEIEEAAPGPEDTFALLMDSLQSPETACLSRALYAAAEGGVAANCRRLLMAGAAPAADALAVAASRGAVDACRVLMEYGASANVPETEVITPLHAAVRSDSVELCAMLIAAGADVSRTSSRPGWTPLYEAIEWGAVGAAEVCRLLIQKGADITPVCSSPGDLTPFQFAVKLGRRSVIKLFAEECGEDPRQRTVAKQTMLELAAAKPGAAELLRSLITNLEVQESMPAQAVLPGTASRRSLSPL